MLPEIELLYNYEYARRLQAVSDDPFADAWQRIIRIGADFEKIFEQTQARILELIPQYSGYDWAEHADAVIPMYLVNTPPSFAHPLTLAVNEEPGEMLEDCIYQLAHRNMYFGFPSEELRQSYTQAVVDHVLAGLNLLENRAPAIDLTSKTVKDYLSHS
ncbi:MAG: hypothetical protein HZC01_01430 [Candidatus Kerfeldbacteria bacterium]|nr:hypothetical protein [Candidatus Kerfeldbacteria bacterium]